MSDIVKQDEVFGNQYNRINSLILKTKQNVVKNINYEMVELYYAIGSTINELIEEYHLEASQNKILKSFSERIIRSDSSVFLPKTFRINFFADAF